MKFDLKIELEKLILIGSDSKFNVTGKSQIETRWLFIKGIEDKIFCLRSEELSKEYPNDLTNQIIDSNYEIIDLERRIKGKIKEIINRQLKEIYEESINKDDLILDYDILKNVDNATGEINLYRRYKFIDEAYLFGKNLRDDERKINYLSLGISNIDKGVISLIGTNIKYDLLNDKFINSENEILLNIYDEREIKFILSYEKYRQGIASNFYNEISRINKFLEGKQTLTVKLKNGTIFKTDARFRNILNIYSNGEIYISRTYGQTIIKGENFIDFQYKVDQLESLKYGKEELKINSENLMIERTNDKRGRNQRNRRRGDVKKWDNIIR